MKRKTRFLIGWGVILTVVIIFVVLTMPWVWAFWLIVGAMAVVIGVIYLLTVLICWMDTGEWAWML